MARGRTIANLAVAITARTSNFSKGMKRVSREVKGFAKLASASAVGGAAVLSSALAVGVARTLKTIDTQAKQARSLKILQDEYGGLAHAFDLAGVEQNQLLKGMSNLAKNTVDVTAGVGEAKVAFTALGIDAHELVKLNPAEQMFVLADALTKVGNASQRVNFSRAIFGRAGTEFLNAISTGGPALRAAADEAAKLGIAITSIEGSTVEEANDQLNRASKLMEGLFIRLTVALAPAISDLAQRFLDWGLEGEGAAARVDSIIREDLIPLIGGFVDSWNQASGAIDLVSGSVLQLAANLLKLTSISPAGLIVRAVDGITKSITGESAVGLSDMISDLEGAAAGLFEEGTKKINDDAVGRFQKFFDDVTTGARARAADVVAASGAAGVGTNAPIALTNSRAGQFQESSLAQVMASQFSSIKDPTTEEVKKSNTYLEVIARNVGSIGAARAV